MPNDSILSVRNATVHYGQTPAVCDLSLDVQAGEVFGLLGPNGSGKSTILAAVAAQRRLSSGSIYVCGLCPREQSLHYRRQLGLVPQELAFYEDLSAGDNLLFFGRLYGLSGALLRQRVEETLERVGLTESLGRPARTYSGGMQRRLNLACALLHGPALLLLDEPTVGLDLHAREAIFAVLRRLRDQGTALVYTTHQLAEVESLCDRIGIMNQGRLQAVNRGRWTGEGELKALFLELTGGSVWR
jgi:ABC-2 type transport system ATP-binding protein